MKYFSHHFMDTTLTRFSIEPPDELYLTVSQGNQFEQWEVPSKAPTQYMGHGYFRYIGKFPPQIAHKIIADYGAQGGVLVDPMCGSGTTLIEAARNGMDAQGFDINPTALLVSNVCTNSIDPQHLYDTYRACETILSEIELLDTPLAQAMPQKARKKSGRDLLGMEHYFEELPLQQLCSIQAFIDGLNNPAINNFFQVALLSILRHVSRANVKKMNTEIDENKKVLPVVSTFRAQLREMLEINTQLWAMNFPQTQISVHEGEAEHIPLPENSVDLVVLHPPYLSGTAFSETVQLQLSWMQFNHKNLRTKELAMRGSYFQKPDGLRKYLVGWSRILQEAYRILKPGGYCGAVIGDGSVDSVRIPMGVLTHEFGVDLGYEVVKNARHLLNHNTGRTLNKKMKFQEVIILRKPVS